MSKGYQCRVERDSIGPDDCGRATTWVIRFPRRVLAETVTHRQSSYCWGDWDTYFTERTTTREISKNSASSRAIPFERMVASVIEDPFVPHWTKNQKGMQGDSLDDQVAIEACNHRWHQAMNSAVQHASRLHEMGVHKQDCNRLLEPFAWTTQIVTTTRPDNFFALRTHHAADPHFRTIARMMYLSYLDSTPTPLGYGEWHLPFTPAEQQRAFRWSPDITFLGTDKNPYKARQFDPDHLFPPLIRQSIARCAWVSYENHDKDGGQEACDRTYARLLSESPVHASPAEHQLLPLCGWRNYRILSGNAEGWLQARKLIMAERVEQFAPSQEDVSAWREEVKQWYQKGQS